MPRATVDGAVFSYFESVALDLDAMRDELREAATAKTREVRELLRRAERDEQQAAEAVARVRRDYTSGDLTASEWRSSRPTSRPSTRPRRPSSRSYGTVRPRSARA